MSQQPKHSANPADHGWTYQGSNAQSRVDFYQNDQGVKMDYYPSEFIMLPSYATCKAMARAMAKPPVRNHVRVHCYYTM